MLEYQKGKVETYKRKLETMAGRVPMDGYENRCIYVIALWQYVEARVIVEDYREGEDIDKTTFDMRLDYMNRNYSDCVDLIMELRDAYSEILNGMYMPSCQHKIVRLFQSDKVRTLWQRLRHDA